jgi:hypothetical protein
MIILRKILLVPFLLLLKIYKYLISPITPPSCRFYPTCSEYSEQSFKKFGVFKGGILTFLRLLRCQPFGNHGYDPVPDEFKIFRKSKNKQRKSSCKKAKC